MTGTTLSFTGLVRGFGSTAVLDGVSGGVDSGETLLVTGANGSGKSTLLRCLAGLLRPETGEIRLEEEGSPLDPVARRRRVGYVAPDVAFYEPLTARENLAFFARLRGIPSEVGDDLLALLDLPPDRLAGALSSGMTQRLRWALALLHEPRVLLLDEPFQNLDEPSEADVRGLLDRHLDRGLAVIATPSPLALPRVAAELRL